MGTTVTKDPPKKGEKKTRGGFASIMNKAGRDIGTMFKKGLGSGKRRSMAMTYSSS